MQVFLIFFYEKHSFPYHRFLHFSDLPPLFAIARGGGTFVSVLACCFFVRIQGVTGFLRIVCLRAIAGSLGWA